MGVSTGGNRWTAIPARRLSGRDLGWRVNVVLVLALVAAVSGPLAFMLSLRAPEQVVHVHRVDAAAALAEQVAVDFLSGQFTRVPTAVGVDPTFGAPRSSTGQLVAEYVRFPLAFIASTQVVDRASMTYGERAYELITVFAVGVDGASWWVSVPVYTDGPYLAATPSVLPRPRTPAPQVPALDYRGDQGQVSPSPAVVSLVAEWASAWASDDRVTLKRLTGDTQVGEYRGISGGPSGFEAQRTVIVSAVSLDTSVQGVQSVAPQNLVVRVAIWLRPAGADLWGQSVELDLLVADAASDLPKVKSWGPAGSAPREPYLNREPVG